VGGQQRNLAFGGIGMKAVKYVLTVVVIMFCFVLGSELYQSRRGHFIHFTPRS
jgi:hypothetical protein